MVFLLLITAFCQGMPPVPEMPLFSSSWEEPQFLEYWKPLTFKKIKSHTTYEFSSGWGSPSWGTTGTRSSAKGDKESSQSYIRATTDSGASGLIRELRLDPGVYPILRWKWLIKKPLDIEKEEKKGGDDFAARIYVTFEYDSKKASLGQRAKYGLAKTLYGKYPPRAAINYVWASRVPQGESWENPYASQAIMVAVESGSEKLGQWVSEERNILEDY
ncbi:MAG: DUF3047 domain-containing protein, partial [Elusimicrobia bacterium]|nr:DUF3047 domain-containing protein [Elusimicrobiota bacterium]